MSLPLPLAVAIERGLESLLKLDPETRERLRVLDGKVVRFEITSPEMRAVVIVTDGRVFVQSEYDGEVDATISGSLPALRSLMSSNDALRRGGVVVSGDPEVGSAVRDVVNGLDIDWQELVSPILGDTVAHKLGRSLDGLGDWWSRTRGALVADTRDWLQDEVELVATSSEVARFGTEVDTLRSAADRIEARLECLEAGGSAGPASPRSTDT